ncbi:hypothetical protein [Psychromonas sp.]|uniref:hypothetical protein n=1 Tax=Psychromonas sp. TaxID=1884585 RepID=UPI003562A75E
MKKFTILRFYSAIKKQPLNFIVPFLFISMLAGCSSTSKRIFNEKTYILGSTVTKSEGELIASELHGTVKSTQNWIGIANSKDGWGPAIFEFSNDYLEKKLFYLGFEEPFLYFLYRQYKKGESIASVEQIEKFVPFDSPFIQVNDFYIEALTMKGTQATFNILSKESFESKKKQFAVLKKEQDEQIELNNIIKATNQARKKAWIAKQSAELLTQITSTSAAFSNVINKFEALDAAFVEEVKRGKSKSESVEIYRAYEEVFNNFTTFFTPVVTAIKAWVAMDNDFKDAVKAGAVKKYFKVALELKIAGENDLQEERYEQAAESFWEAREEISRIIVHIKN